MQNETNRHRRNGQQDEPLYLPLTGAEISRILEAGPSTANAGGSAGHSRSLWADYYETVLRHRWLILAFVVAGSAVALLFSFVTRPVYRARTSLDIQNLNADFMNMREIAPTGQAGAASAEVYIQTEIKLLESATLRDRTVRRMLARAAQVSLAPRNPIAQLRDRIPLLRAAPVDAKAVLDFTAKRINLKPIGLTHLVEITCDGWDAPFAAEFCNTMISEFQQQDREVRLNEAQKTSEWLSRQLADVRVQLAQSEKKLDDAAQRDGLLFSNQNTTVGEEKLRELQAELMKAQADRVGKEAQYEITKTASVDSLPMILDDSQVRDDQSKLGDLRRQLAQISPPLTDAHPKVQHLKAQIQELENDLDHHRGQVTQRVGNEFQAAQHRERLLAFAYSMQEKKVSQELGKESQVSMLRREVESGQHLYQTLLQRVKEAGFASAMQASTVRVVDSALAPLLPIAPRPARAGAAGLVIGAILGIALAFFKQRTETALRAPGEAPLYLNLRELGVIPSARAGLAGAYAKRLPASGGTLSLLPAPTGNAPAKPTKEKAVDLATWSAGESLVAEAYRSATYSILRDAQAGTGGKAYVVTSPNPGEGKTSVTCNLGFALAQANKRVVLVDADLRRPRLHASLNVPNKVGLRNVLRGEFDLRTASAELFCHRSEFSNIRVLPSGSGSGDAGGLLYAEQLKAVVDSLRNAFDIVLIGHAARAAFWPTPASSPEPPMASFSCFAPAPPTVPMPSAHAMCSRTTESVCWARFSTISIP